MAIDRVRIELTGGTGGNGITTLYFLDGAAAQPAVAAFADRWADAAPDDVTFNVPDAGDRINEETGEMVGVWTGGVTSGSVGLAPEAFIAGAGLRVRWLTAGIVAGRRVAGSTFLVPVAAGIFAVNGQPGALWLGNFLTAATTLINSTPGNMVVWSRPKTGRVGSKHPVVTATIPVQSTYLTSRRQ